MCAILSAAGADGTVIEDALWRQGDGAACRVDAGAGSGSGDTPFAVFFGGAEGSGDAVVVGVGHAQTVVVSGGGEGDAAAVGGVMREGWHADTATVAVGSQGGDAVGMDAARGVARHDGAAVLYLSGREGDDAALRVNVQAAVGRLPTAIVFDEVDVMRPPAFIAVAQVQAVRAMGGGDGDAAALRVVAGNVRRIGHGDARLRVMRGGGGQRAGRAFVAFVFDLHGDVPAVRRAVVVGRRHGELDAFFFAVVHALPVFEFEGAVGGDFKAAVADGVSVGIAAVGIADAQFAHGCPAALGFDPVRGAVARVQGDGGRAVVRRAAVDIQRATERFFVVSGVVFIGGAHGDFVPGVVAGERVGLAVGISDGIAVAQPLVLHVVSGKTVAVADGRGEFAADFCLAAEGDFAFVVCGRGCFVVDGGRDAVFACGNRRPLRGADFDGVGFVALSLAVGGHVHGEGGTVFAFTDGDAMGAEGEVAVVGRAMFDGYIDADIAVGDAGEQQLLGKSLEVFRQFFARFRDVDVVVAPVRPSHHVGDFARIRVGEDTFEQVGVKLRVNVAMWLDHLVAAAPEFGQRRNLATRFGHAGEYRHVFHDFFDPAVFGEFGGIHVVAVIAEDIHHVIARIKQAVAAFIAVEVAIRCKGGEDLPVCAVFLDVVDDVTEELLVSFRAAAFVVPPRPFAVAFVQRAEDEGDFAAIGAHRVLRHRDDGIQPFIQRAVQVAARQQAFEVDLGKIVRAVRARHRVIPMRRHGGDTAQRIDFGDCHPHCLAVFSDGFAAIHRRFHHRQTDDGRITASQRVNIGDVSLLVGSGASGAQSLVLAEKNAVPGVLPQGVEQLGGIVRPGQRRKIEINGVRRLATFADFAWTAQRDARHIGRRRIGGDIQRATGWFFCCALVVGVCDVDADFVPGVVAGERVSAAVGFVDRLAIA